MSISVRLFRSVFGLYIFVAIIITGFQMFDVFKNSKQNIEKELHDLANIFSLPIAQAVWIFNQESLNVLVHGISKFSFIAGVEVIDSSKTFSAKFGNNLNEAKNLLDTDMMGMLNEGNKNTISKFFGFNIKLVHKTKDGIENHVGNLFIHSSRELVAQAVEREFTLILISATAKTVALWIIFLYFSNRILTTPLKRFINAVSHVDLASLSSSELNIVPVCKDELFKLQCTFNSMVKNLYGSIRAQKHTEKLRQTIQNYILPPFNFLD
jgi:methyl-accepting chemotaxis protein